MSSISNLRYSLPPGKISWRQCCHLRPSLVKYDVERVVRAQVHLHLLVPVVHVDVGVGNDAEPHPHHGFHHHEASREGHVVLIVAVIDHELVVAAHLHAALRVGQTQPGVRVEGVGVDGLGNVVDGVALAEALAVVAGEELVRWSPVGLTMDELVAVAGIVVGEVVEGDVEGRGAVKVDHGHGQPVVAGHNLQ